MAERMTFYFYDYETFGKHPAYDRPAQFAGQRTDVNFNPLGDPLVIYCRPAEDYLPEPEATLISGITPQQTLLKGLSEAEFARQIHAEFSQPNSCILGYNNIRFDDEFTRHLFYRNFYDPYAYCWQGGNSRWDLLDVVRACYALRPDGIEWPIDMYGNPSLKLERLSHANQIDHQQAHDALSDVYATIGIARLTRKAQPRLFDYLFQLRAKQRVAALIDVSNQTPLLHVSGMFGAARCYASWIAPIMWHLENPNAVIVCDLAGDIAPLIEKDSESLRQHLYTRSDQLGKGESPLPLKLIHTNRCPVLAPLKVLSPADITRLQFNPRLYLDNLELITSSRQICEKVGSIFQRLEKDTLKERAVDGRLYDGFFSPSDQAIMRTIGTRGGEQLAELNFSYQDERVGQLLFQYRARNYPETLNADERRCWLERCRAKVNGQIDTYLNKVRDLMQMHGGNPRNLALLQDLLIYAEQLALIY